jgi:hypothetical protein
VLWRVLARHGVVEVDAVVLLEVGPQCVRIRTESLPQR